MLKYTSVDILAVTKSTPIDSTETVAMTFSTAKRVL